MRVAVVGPTHPYKGGVAAHTTTLAHELAEAGHDVTLVSWSHLYPSRLYPGEQAVPGGAPDVEPFPRTVRALSWARPDTWVRTGRRLRGFDAVIVVHVIPAVVPAHLALLRAAGIGTGPYKVKEFKPGMRSIAVRNESYWKPNRPYQDEIEFVGITDESARVNALLRRAAGWSKPTLECGPVALDLAAQTVSVNGSNVDLTSYEYKVLEYLMMHAGELVSKADLTEHIYQQDFDRDSNVLEVFIGRLRKKLDPDGELKPIETVRGRGYRFAIPRNEG